MEGSKIGYRITQMYDKESLGYRFFPEKHVIFRVWTKIKDKNLGGYVSFKDYFQAVKYLQENKLVSPEDLGRFRAKNMKISWEA